MTNHDSQDSLAPRVLPPCVPTSALLFGLHDRDQGGAQLHLDPKFGTRVTASLGRQRQLVP